MLPRPTLDAAIQSLKDHDSYKVILNFVYDERDRFYADFRTATCPFETGKIAGSIASLDELLSIIDPDRGE